MDSPQMISSLLALGVLRAGTTSTRTILSCRRTRLTDVDLDLQLQDIFHHVVFNLKLPTTPVQGDENVQQGVNISVHFSTQNNSAMVLCLIYGAGNALCPALQPDIPVRDESTAITGAILHFVHGSVAPKQCSVHYSYVHYKWILHTATPVTHTHQHAFMGT